MRVKWTKEALRAEAPKFRNRSDFLKKRKGAYKAAAKHGMLDELFGPKDASVRIPTNTVSAEELTERARPFEKRNEFKKKSPSSYTLAKEKKVLDQVCAHMQHAYRQWTRESIIAVAKQCKSRNEFHRCGGYAAAKCRGILSEVLPLVQSKRTSWTEEKILQEAWQFKTRRAFAKGNPAAYGAAVHRGILKKACAHMVYAYATWSEATVRNEAKKYRKLDDFKKTYAYRAALRLGIIGEITARMR